MKEVREAMARVLDRMSLADVVGDIQMVKHGKDSPSFLYLNIFLSY